MKSVLIGITVFFALGITTQAQTKKSGTKKSTAKAATTKGTTKKAKSNTTVSNTATLSTTTTHSAYDAPAANTQFYIADPVVRALDARASGTPIRISGSGIVGMPRGSYGFGRGQLRLYSSGATTSGGITGNGSVGTGSFPGSIGTNAAAPGVNGKSPYAGSHMWGLNGAIPQGYRSDSSIRRIEPKRND